ncbi:acetyl-CoA hydrolase/transferase family protein [Sphingobium sp.]|uniref:acetyl-CoA hydrolase/transferase family protein n=1 Tax=Sphingobium sp. TaxID=1912891 RepID=UPI0028BEC902|nr:acetyl-CoA hydrolase/transferase C-terminal domain-containing protein [Sphingobium sp.]
MRAGTECALGALEWRNLVRPDDLVVWAQGCAEPTGLTGSLIAARAEAGGFRAFVGISHGASADPANSDYISYRSYCGTGNNRKLGEKLDIMPIHYTALAPTLAAEAPVVLLTLAEGDDADHFSFGMAGDYIGDLLHRARLVIAEVSPHYPRTGTGKAISRHALDLIVRTQSVPLLSSASRLGPPEQRIARHVAGIIEDGSTLQLGLGNIPAAILDALSSHRDLGIHSGMIVDGVADLAEAGIITNARKSIDQGLTVTGLLSGSERLMRWADRNGALSLRPTSYTHDANVLASIDRFVAINSAIEIDLTGQVNAEVAGGRYVGAVGGGAVFLRGAHASRGGLPIIALPSCAGDSSRIVETLSGPVSTARSDVGIVVTEHGIADLRGASIAERRRRLLAITDPTHVAKLEQGSGTNNL